MSVERFRPLRASSFYHKMGLHLTLDVFQATSSKKGFFHPFQTQQIPDKQPNQQSRDNYDEVEMDIDSDPESPGM